MLRKLLCATDGSHASEKAVEFAIALARRLEVPLTFLTVSTVSPESISHTHFWESTLLEAGAAQVHRELASAQGKAEAAGLKEVHCFTACGHSVAATIIDFAEKNGYEHLIVGSIGRTGISRLLLGSIAGEVVTKAHCPVTVVR